MSFNPKNYKLTKTTSKVEFVSNSDKSTVRTVSLRIKKQRPRIKVIKH